MNLRIYLQNVVKRTGSSEEYYCVKYSIKEFPFDPLPLKPLQKYQILVPLDVIKSINGFSYQVCKHY